MKITAVRTYMQESVAYVEITANGNIPSGKRPTFRFGQGNGDPPVTGTANDDVTSGHVAKYACPLSNTFSVGDGLTSLEITDLGGLPALDIADAPFSQTPELEF
jgi:hypothetical protein